MSLKKNIKAGKVNFLIAIVLSILIINNIYAETLPKSETTAELSVLDKVSSKNTNIKVEADAINKPLAAEASVIAKTTSDEDKGLCTTSVIVPIILPIINEELECAKLCWITCIIIKPLAKNFIYGTPNTFAL